MPFLGVQLLCPCIPERLCYTLLAALNNKIILFIWRFYYPYGPYKDQNLACGGLCYLNAGILSMGPTPIMYGLSDFCLWMCVNLQSEKKGKECQSLVINVMAPIYCPDIARERNGYVKKMDFTCEKWNIGCYIIIGWVASFKVSVCIIGFNCCSSKRQKK